MSMRTICSFALLCVMGMVSSTEVVVVSDTSVVSGLTHDVGFISLFVCLMLGCVHKDSKSSLGLLERSLPRGYKVFEANLLEKLSLLEREMSISILRVVRCVTLSNVSPIRSKCNAMFQFA